MSDAVRDERSDYLTGQRGYVALWFSDVCDYTAYSERVEPEEAGQLQSQLHGAAETVVHKHGGELVQAYGDGFLAVFGFPAAREDVARRAIEAALEFHACVRELKWQCALPAGFEVRVHSGVHVGLVYGRRGSTLHGTYDLMGDAVNTTSRISAAASRDEILATRAALHGIEDFFALTTATSLPLKGKSQPVWVQRVVGRTEVRTRFEASTRRGLTAFVDRELEMARLQALLTSSGPSPSSLIVSGTAGVGKTRLLEEFRARHAHAAVRVLFGSCDNYSELVPFEPFIHILRQVFGLQTDTPAPEAAERVSAWLTDRSAELREHHSTFLEMLELAPRSPVVPGEDSLPARAWAALLDELCASGRVVVVLDDWQWADDASRTLLAALLSDSGRRSAALFIIGTRASAGPEHAATPGERLELRPFSIADSERVIQCLLPANDHPELTSSLFRRSGGNALFLEELCRSLPKTSWLLDGASADDTSIPATLQGVIHVRVARLPPEQAAVLRIASVIGMEFSVPLLAQLANQPQLAETLEALRREDLIYPSGELERFRFKHGITREVIYDSVLASERRRIHAAVAHSIEAASVTEGAADEAETLAYHCRGSGHHERAAHYAELAGDKAMSQHSLDRARFHYGAACSALEQLPQTDDLRRRWLRLVDKWAVPCAYSPLPDQLRVLERAVDVAGELADAQLGALMLNWLGWLHLVLGDYRAAIAAYQRALEVAASVGFTKLVAQQWTNLGQTYGAAGDHDEALRYLTHGLALKQTQGRSESRARALGFAHASACKALVHSDRGEFDLVEQHFQDALEIVRGTGQPMEASVLTQRCFALLRQGEYEACRQLSETAVRVAERARIAFSAAIGDFFGAFAHFMLDGGRAALARLRHASDCLEANGQNMYRSFLDGCLAEAHEASADVERAALYAERALSRASQGDVLGDAMAYRVLARLHACAGWGDAASAAELIERAFAAGRARASAREATLCTLLVAELHLAAGETEPAARTALAAQAEFERMHMRWHAHRAQRVIEATRGHG